MTHILVADDHAVVRRGVLQILDEARDSFLVDEASSGGEVLRAARERDYDLILLDIALPDINGMEVLSSLQKEHPGIDVLMLSMYPEKQYASRALKAGASGYLTKDSAPAELLSAVRRILQGGKYVTQSLAEELVAELSGEGGGEPHENLSNREYQVMLLLAEGKMASDIAQELSLSVKTISTYRARILEKLNLESTAEIIRYAFRHGLAQ